MRKQYVMPKVKTAEMEVTYLCDDSPKVEVTVPDMPFDYEGSGCTCDWQHGNCNCDMNDPFSSCGCM